MVACVCQRSVTSSRHAGAIGALDGSSRRLADGKTLRGSTYVPRYLVKVYYDGPTHGRPLILECRQNSTEPKENRIFFEKLYSLLTLAARLSKYIYMST